MLAQAKRSDDRRSQGQSKGPLDGIPVGLKGVICVQGQPLTAANRILEHFVSPYDATVTRKLKQAGAVLAGRLNLDEFAMGSSTENSAYGPTRNPWNLDRVPGGSSGGSSAAVARGKPPFPGLGHWWFHSPARLPLRSRRHETDLWYGFPLRACSLRFLPRPDRALCPNRSRCGPPVGGDIRARPSGFHQLSSGSPKLFQRPWRKLLRLERSDYPRSSLVLEWMMT